MYNWLIFKERGRKLPSENASEGGKKCRTGSDGPRNHSKINMLEYVVDMARFDKIVELFQSFELFSVYQL